MISIKINIKPLSMNNAYPSDRNGRRYLTKEAKMYKDEIGWAARSAMYGQEIMKGDVTIYINFYFPDKRTDTNNCIKLVLDALQGIVYENDRQIHEEHYYRFYDKENPGMEIFIEEYKSKLSNL